MLCYYVHMRVSCVKRSQGETKHKSGMTLLTLWKGGCQFVLIFEPSHTIFACSYLQLSGFQFVNLMEFFSHSYMEMMMIVNLYQVQKSLVVEEMGLCIWKSSYNLNDVDDLNPHTAPFISDHYSFLFECSYLFLDLGLQMTKT